MKEIKIFDTLFSHAKYSTDYQESKYIIWNRNLKTNDYAVFTDNSLMLAKDSKTKKKIAWLVESPQITPYCYNWIKENYYIFDEIWTFKKDLISLDPKFKQIFLGGCWIKPEDQQIFEKSKNVSMIVSDKKMTNAQKLRHWIVYYYKDQISIYGRKYNPIKYKLDGLKDFRFQIVVENTKEDYYFTEKLIDCFRTGTIPIYYGCHSIDEIFNIDGMILFNKHEDIKKILPTLTINYYNSKMEAIKDNFKRSEKFLITEDYIDKNIMGL